MAPSVAKAKRRTPVCRLAFRRGCPLYAPARRHPNPHEASMTNEARRPLRPVAYADSGVNIDAGNALVAAIKPLVRATRRPGADAEIGGFGGLFDLKAAGYRDPVLVAATDGVGTKLRI